MKKSILLLIFLSFIFCIHSIEILSYNAQFKNIGAGSAILKTTIMDNFTEEEIQFSFRTKKIIDIFYKLRENTLMRVDVNNSSLNYIKKDSQHGKRFKKHEASFNNLNNHVYFNNDSLFFNHPVYNPLSIISFLRKQKLSLGDKFTFDIYNTGKIKTIGMQVIEEEKIKIKNSHYDCYVLAPFYLSSSDTKNKKGEIKLWISKDLYLPVIIRQNANFGEIILKLNNIQYED